MVESEKKDRKISRTYKKLKRKILAKHIYWVRTALILVIILTFVGLLLFVRGLLAKSNMGKYFHLAYEFVRAPREDILQERGRTNILILGKSGEGHIAPDLTDTMILASVDHAKGKENITLVSLPRDIWIDDLRAKLNSVYYWGEKRKEGGGPVLTKSVVEEITGVPVHYVVTIDFSGFVEVIDALGGVTVNVEHSFVDKKYPIAGREDDLCDGDLEYGCRYETLEFKQGEQIMDGETALKFVRSRQSEDENEGTDLARSRRQQLVISAIKNKVLSREILFSYSKMMKLKTAYDKYVQTDLSDEAIAILTRRGLQARGQITPHVLPEELLENPEISPRYDNLYVFIPKAGDWSEVKKWIQDIFGRSVGLDLVNTSL